MSVPAEAAIRAWINAPATGLSGNGAPISNGAFSRRARSPASGSYAVVQRMSIASRAVAEEDGAIDQARLSVMIYAGTQEAAEAGAAAYATAVQRLSGKPVPAGDTGVIILVSDNLSGPQDVPMPEGGGEQFAFEVAADFLLTQEQT